jgi:hypothetical protein
MPGWLDRSCARYAGAAALSSKSAPKAEPAADMIAVTAIAAPSLYFTMPSSASADFGCSSIPCRHRPLTVKTNGVARFNAVASETPAFT